MKNTNTTRLHAVVHGLVQGVNFRYYTRREAEARGVTGWVRNVADGRVEAVFEGEEANVQWMVQWCHRGPSRAQVDQVEVEWLPYTGEFDHFGVAQGWSW